MPRLARPVPRDRSRHPAPFQHALKACSHKFISFAAVNLPTSLSEPLNGLNLNLDLDFPWVLSHDEPAVSRRRLRTVREFFQYTDDEDAAFFALLDRDGDGRVTVDDLKECLRKHNLPGDYAHQFIERARGGRWWSSSINFQEFKSLADDNESKMLRAFSSLETDAKGNLDLNKLKGSLAKMDLPATESDARAMMRALGKAEDTTIAYGEFRRFAILMPRDKLLSYKELNLKWLESATCVPIGGTIEQGVSTVQLLLKAALAGGLSSGCSTLLMHPLDTLKTRVQSIPGASIGSVVKDIPTLGKKALYRGIIPASTGAFSSHGIRTCAYEAGILGMSSLGLPFLQAQPLASLLGTVVGTVVRIPCEVLKQQLQRGNQENVRMAISEISRLDGTKGFFRGAGALMCREVPFYVAGMVLYEQYKRLFNGEYLGGFVRQLSSAETIGIGALAGASASFISTPADVVKSRLMTTAAGSNFTTTQIVVDLIQKEGFLALFKGALFRAVWIAPLGAMNFAGYELAKRAMGVNQAASGDPEPQKDLAPAQMVQPAEDSSTGVAAAPAPPQSNAASVPPVDANVVASVQSGSSPQEKVSDAAAVGDVEFEAVS